MKKWLTIMMVTAAVLAACDDGPAEENEPDTTEDTAESNGTEGNGETETSEEESTENAEESEHEDVEMSAAGIIDYTIGEYGDTVSYQMTHNYVIDNGDEEEIRLITTRSDQNELKVDVNTPSDTFSHYIIDGEHFIYTNGDFEFQAEDVDIEGSAYGDILSSLEAFKDADFEESEDGYKLTESIEDIEAVESLLPEEISSDLPEGSASGTIELLFNEDFQFNGSSLELTLETEDETFELSSSSEIKGIGTLEVIEKPNAMSE